MPIPAWVGGWVGGEGGVLTQGKHSGAAWAQQAHCTMTCLPLQGIRDCTCLDEAVRGEA